MGGYGLTWVAMRRAFEETVRTTSMVMAIIIFAAIFSHVIALIGAPKALLGLVVSLGLPKWAFFTAVFSFLLVIAYALEELSVMIILLPILFPLITGLGFDPVWFGIIMVVWLEIGFITPPVGLNLFVIQGLMPGSTAREVTVGTTPYVLLMILMVDPAVSLPGARPLAPPPDDGALGQAWRVLSETSKRAQTDACAVRRAGAAKLGGKLPAVVDLEVRRRRNPHDHHPPVARSGHLDRDRAALRGGRRIAVARRTLAPRSLGSRSVRATCPRGSSPRAWAGRWRIARATTRA